jgi:DNA-binding MarR family transcriptional regulator
MNRSNPYQELIRDCLAVRVRIIARSVTAPYDRAVAPHGVTIAQVHLMAALAEVGPCAPGRLGEALQLERSTVSRNLDLLVKAGYVSVPESDAKGMRQVALSAKGRHKIEAVMPQWREAQKEAVTLLGQDGVDAVRGVARGVWPVAAVF